MGRVEHLSPPSPSLFFLPSPSLSLFLYPLLPVRLKVVPLKYQWGLRGAPVEIELGAF